MASSGRGIAQREMDVKDVKWKTGRLKVGAVVAGVILLMVALMTTIDVMMRYFFNRPWEGSLEVVELAFTFIVFLGFASAFVEKREIRVDVVITHLKGRAACLMDMLSALLSATFFVLIIWYGWLNWLRAWQIHDTSIGALRIPTVVPWAAILLGSALALTVTIIGLVASTRVLLCYGRK